MIGSSEVKPRISLKRVVVLAVVGVVATSLILGGGLWTYRYAPRWVYWKAGVIALTGAEVLYCALAVIVSLGFVVLGLSLIVRRRERAARRKLARGLLLCVSLGFAMVVAEGASAVWLFASQGSTAVPAGGLRKAKAKAKGKGVPAKIGGGFTRINAPTEFADPPGDREIDVVVLGESSAEGVPYNRWVSIGHIVCWQLNEVFPGRPTRLAIPAISGSTLELQQAELSKLTRRPDLMIIYCGHNEITARIGPERDAERYVDEGKPTALSMAVERIEAVSALCGLIHQTADKCRVAIPPPRHASRAVVDVPAYTRTEFGLLLNDFRRRLDAMVSYALQVGATPVLIAPPGNDTGFEPNRSVLPATTLGPEREAFAREFLAARAKEADAPESAQAAYRALLERQPGFAEAHYRLAQLLERAGSWDLAYREYKNARDLDGYPMRCPTEFQAVYREVADRHGCILIDGQSYFHAVGRQGLLDEHLFHDAMHPSFRGQIALAQAVVHELQARKVFGWPASSPPVLIDPARCSQKFNINPAVWESICLWGIMFYDLTYPMRYDQSHRVAMKEVFGQAYNRIHAGATPESVGLPNIGLPAPVRAATSAEIRGRG